MTQNQHKLKTMDFKQIQELIKLVNDSNIGEVTIEQKDFRLTIKQKEEQVTQMIATPIQAAPVYSQLPPAAPAAQPAGGGDKAKTESPVSSNTITIKSPMIGTFYRRSGPDKPSFVE